jgi:histidyl-tRNA synthetase
VIDVVREVYRRYGFEPLETPAFENITTLLGNYGEEGNKLIFKILRRGEHEASGGTDLALRYDLTVPLARVVAQYRSQLPPYFRRYQIQPVWRAEKPGRGRFREFYQCDIDAIGSTSLVIEADLIAAVTEVLMRLGFHDFIIRLNHRQILTSMLESLGIPGPLHGETLVALDKLDKMGIEGVGAELEARGIPRAGAAACLNLLTCTTAAGKDVEDVLEILRKQLAGHEPGLRAIDDLRTIIGLSEATGASTRIRIDPSLARGLSYYTGAIMEVTVPDLTGSLGGGGRYDKLVGMFLGRDVPACGFSLGLERIILLMGERDMFPPEVASPSVDVTVAFLDDTCRAAALGVATALRQGGLAVELHPEAGRKVDKLVKHALSRRVPLLAFVAPEDLPHKQVTVRNLDSRIQRTVPLVDVLPTVVSMKD